MDGGARTGRQAFHFLQAPAGICMHAAESILQLCEPWGTHADACLHACHNVCDVRHVVGGGHDGQTVPTATPRHAAVPPGTRARAHGHSGSGQQGCRSKARDARTHGHCAAPRGSDPLRGA